jgi:hypothetical protein
MHVVSLQRPTCILQTKEARHPASGYGTAVHLDKHPMPCSDDSQASLCLMRTCANSDVHAWMSAIPASAGVVRFSGGQQNDSACTAYSQRLTATGLPPPPCTLRQHHAPHRGNLEATPVVFRPLCTAVTALGSLRMHAHLDQRSCGGSVGR